MKLFFAFLLFVISCQTALGNFLFKRDARDSTSFAKDSTQLVLDAATSVQADSISLPSEFPAMRLSLMAGVGSNPTRFEKNHWFGLSFEDSISRVSILRHVLQRQEINEGATVSGSAVCTSLGRNIMHSLGSVFVQAGLGVGEYSYTDTTVRVTRAISEPIALVQAGMDFRLWAFSLGVTVYLMNAKEFTIWGTYATFSIGLLKAK